MGLRRLAWGVWVLCAALSAMALGFLAANGGTRHANSLGTPVADAVFAVLFLSFPTVGAAIASREPRNAIGWLFLGAGVGALAEDALLGYAAYALVVSPGSLPGGDLAALLADAVWLPTIGAASLLLFVLFPTGRPMSRRWRWFVWVVSVDLAVFGVGTLVYPGPLYFFPDRRNPWALDAVGEAVRQVVDDVTGPVLLFSLVVGLVALVLRFRRAAGVERLQMKWLVWAGGVWVAALPGLIWIGSTGDGNGRVAGILLGDLVFSLIVVLIPVAVGTAILRHRLYDIDVVINRTLVYGGLTAVLAGVYLGSVLLLQVLLGPVTGESDLAVAGSTLAVAALVRPLRSRFQAGVDRRFYRARYDAAQTVADFAGRLRQELDLDALGGDLRQVVMATVAPSHVSLWLREEAR